LFLAEHILLSAFFALILAVSVYIFSQRNYTVNTLELKIIFFRISTIGKFLKQIEDTLNLTPWDGHMSTFILNQTLQVAP
jgi:hypothetical protein